MGGSSGAVIRTFGSLLEERSFVKEFFLAVPSMSKGLSGRIQKLVEDNEGTILSVEDRSHSAAWEAGCKAATGEWLMFLRPGDELRPSGLGKIRAVLDKNPKMDLVAGEVLACDREGHPLSCDRVKQGIIPPEEILLHSCPPLGSLLVRQTLARRVGGFARLAVDAAEWDFLSRCVLERGIAARVPVPAISRRFSAGSPPDELRRETAALLRVVERNFSHDRMPIRTARWVHAARGEVYFQAALTAALSFQIDLFHQFLAHALENHPGLLKRRSRLIREQFIWRARLLPLADLAYYADFLSENVPAEAKKMRRATRHLLAYLREDAFRRAMETGSYKEALASASRLALQHPARSLRQTLRRKRFT